MEDETQLRTQMNQLAAEANYWRNVAEELQRRLISLQGLIAEHKGAVAALNALPEEPKDTFVPLGGGAFLKAKTNGKDKVIVEVGAQVFVEGDRQNAIKIIEKREQDLSHQGELMGEQLGKASMRLEELNDAAQSLQAQRMPTGAPAKPVAPSAQKPKANNKR